jgi:hypothetical protein
MNRRRLLPLLAAPLFAQRGTNVGRRIPPVDHAARDPKLLAFRNTALAAAARRDAAWFLARLTPEPYSSFSGRRTPEDFASFWQLADPAGTPFWKELPAVLRLGGCFSDPAHFVSPYFHALFPSDIDAWEHEVVIRPAAPLRAEPDPRAPVLESLRFDIVEIQAFNEEPWRFVRSASGRLGYVERAALRSPHGPRVTLERVQDQWRLAAFLAGD